MDIDVRRIAKLAMLSIPENEIDTFAQEMESIVKMCEHLPDLESSGALIEIDNQMELREDIIVASSSRSDILANVPKSIAGCIVVPKTAEE